MEQNRNMLKNRELFPNPFNKRYWQLSLFEFKNVRTLVIAALIIALRVAVKQFKIPILPPSLYFGFDFLINSAGAMIYGPIVALAVGAVSDTIGAMLFPIGTYFFPFIFVEMMSGFVFALFLYRQKLSTWRIVLSRLAVVIICNFIINPIIMTWNNIYFMKDPYEFITLARVIKNAAMFPLESIVLVFWLGALNAITYRLSLTHCKPEKLTIKAKHILALLIALIIAIFAIFGYMRYKNSSDAEKNVKKIFAYNEETMDCSVETEKIDSTTYYIVSFSGKPNSDSEGLNADFHYDPASKLIKEQTEAIAMIAEKLGCNEDDVIIDNLSFKFAADSNKADWYYYIEESDSTMQVLEYKNGKIEESTITLE